MGIIQSNLLTEPINTYTISRCAIGVFILSEICSLSPFLSVRDSNLTCSIFGFLERSKAEKEKGKSELGKALFLLLTCGANRCFTAIYKELELLNDYRSH